MRGIPSSILAGLIVLALAGSVMADARIITGGEAVPVESRDDGPSAFRFLVGSGMSAAGDLFAFEIPVPRPLEAPVGGTVTARRFTATLDEDVLLDVGMLYRLNPDLSVRLTGRWSEMGVTALANDTQIVTPAPWDVMTITQLSALLEWDLAVGTWVPYLTAGATWLSLDALDDGLDQSGVVPTAGAGLRYRMGDRVGLWAEILDTVRQVESASLAGSSLPSDGELTERGPQHFVGLTVGIELGF